MKRRDIYWVAAYGLLAAATVLLCVTGGFAWFNAMYPYLAGFIQFSVYATAGELLSGRMLEGHWQINRATWFKSVSWGVGGLLLPWPSACSARVRSKPWRLGCFPDMEMLWR